MMQMRRLRIFMRNSEEEAGGREQGARGRAQR